MLTLSWLTGKQTLSPKEELFLDLYQECSKIPIKSSQTLTTTNDNSFTLAQHESLLNITNNFNNTINNNNYNKQLQSLTSSHVLSTHVKTRLDRLFRDDPKNNIVNRKRDGSSPFFIACKLGHYNIVKYFLEHCDVDIEQRGCYESLEDLNVHYVSPIWVASVSGHVKIVELLIQHKANVNSISDTGSTPLRSVCFLCRYDDGNNYSNLLESPNRNHRIDNEISLDNNDIPIGELNNTEPSIGSTKDENYIKIVRLLVKNGADISIANYNGGTCLINSVHNFKLTKFIIDNGAEINASDHQGKTALHYAISKGRLEVTKLLLSRGANPMLLTSSREDALQLCCIGGHVAIFEHLIRTFKFSKTRLIGAYKLLGSSILELNYDLTKVRELWSKALSLTEELNETFVIIKNSNNSLETIQEEWEEEECEDDSVEDDDENKRNAKILTRSDLCDIRRSLAFGDIKEITTESELVSLSADEFRIQSLIISERILGPTNRETIQRLLSRGTNYIMSLRPDRCIDLWIYALELKLRCQSIFNSETLLAVETITKLFFDMLSQSIDVKFQDIYDVLSLLIDHLEDCEHHLSQMPVSQLHQNIFDRLLEIIKNLLLFLSCTTVEQVDKSNRPDSLLEQLKQEQNNMTQEMIKRIVEIDPRTSDGSSLLHVCIVPGLIDKSEPRKLIANFSSSDAIGLIIKLANLLIENGMDTDVANYNGLSPLQVLCLRQVSGLMDKNLIIKRLVEIGAHVDRRPSSPEQGEIIRQSLRDAGIDPVAHMRLSCLAARKLAEVEKNQENHVLTRDLRDLIAIH